MEQPTFEEMKATVAEMRQMVTDLSRQKTLPDGFVKTMKWLDVGAPNPATPLGAEALALRARLRANPDGERCKVCAALAKFYKYTLSRSAVRWLIDVYRLDQQTPGVVVRADEVRPEDKSRDYNRLGLWDLIAQPATSDPSKSTSGLWCITEKGRRFVRLEIAIPRWAVTTLDGVEYETPVLRLDEFPLKGFDYAEHMNR